MPSHLAALASLLVAVTPALATGAVQERSSSRPDEESPLALHAERVERGMRRLVELGEHLAPPRNRMEVRVASQSRRRGHTFRPDVHIDAESAEDVRIFRRGDVWQIEATPVATTEGEEPRSVIACDGLLCSTELRTPTERLRANLVMRAAFPEALVQFLRRNGRVQDVFDGQDGELDVLLEFSGGRVLVRTIDLQYDGGAVPGLVGIDWVTHDQVLGDVLETLNLRFDESPGPGVVRGWRIDGPFGTYEESTVTRLELDSRTARTVQMAECEPTWGEWPDVSSAPLAKGVHELLIPEHDQRVVAVESARGWVVLEAPVSPVVGEAIVAELRRLAPELGFAYVVASHHHPHCVGALRTFVAEGAAVVCADAVAAYLEHLLERPRTLVPDALATSPLDDEPEFVRLAFGEEWAPPGLEGRLAIVETAGQSPHTEAHLMFVLPEQGLAFGGDLLWVPRGERVGPPSPRTIALARILESTGHEIEEFLSGWPVSPPASFERGDPGPFAKWRDRVTVRELARYVGQ